MSSLKFGTSGLRGLVVDLEGWPSYAHALAFLRSAGKPSSPDIPLLIGRDLRASSPEIAAAVAAAARDAGVAVLDCGAVPTPALALEGLRRGAPAIMVTGSHIPDDRNGLKFYTAQGEITKADEAAILAALPAAGTLTLEAPAPAYPQALAAYTARYVDGFGPGALAGLRVGVYQHSSVSRDVLVEILAALGAEPVPFGRADVFVPVDTEAHRPEDLAALRTAAAGTRLDAIVSTDGDADRPLLADAGGEVLRGDVIGLIASRYLGIKAIAVPVTAASAIERCGGFDAVVRTRVGSPFVIAGMEEAARAGHGSVAGFEANGGFLLGSDVAFGQGGHIAALPTRDAVLPILATLAAARAAHLGLAALVASLGAGFAASDRIKDAPSDRSAAFLDKLSDTAFRDTFLAPLGRSASIDRLDGFRMILADGRIIHFRPSGNAPELRCYAEAATAQEAEAMVAWGLGAAASAMGLS